MSKLFSMDSKFMRVMGRIGDLILLNFLFIMTSLPVVTIGASSVALYTVCFRLGTDREEGTTKSYFKAFVQNFKQATILWLLLFFCLATALINTLFFLVMPNALRYVSILFGILFLLALFILTYIFPLMSQFESKKKPLFLNSLIMSMGYLPRTVLMAALNAFPWVLLSIDMYHFLYGSMIWFMIYFSGIAYLNSRILRKVFAPYMTEETNESGGNL